MNFNDITTTVCSALAITVAVVMMIKVGEAYDKALDTVNKAGEMVNKSSEVIDIVYKNRAAIDKSLGFVSKLLNSTSSSNKNP